MDNNTRIGSNDLVISGPATVNINIPTTSIAGAFNMLDVFTNGFEFIKTYSDRIQLALNGYWQADSTGTCYCPPLASGGAATMEKEYMF